MADQIDTIYKEFVAAMDEYNQAMIAMDQSISALRTAERKLQTAFNNFTDYMGEAPPYSAGGRDGGDPFSLFKTLTGKSGSVENLFDIGSWF